MISAEALRRAAVLLVAVLCAAAGVVGLVRADDGLRRVGTVVDGVPLETVSAGAATGRGPGVVVVHGFAGSTPLMRGFADTLARSGYVVVLLDAAGHGRSRVPFGSVPLVDDLATALRHLRGQPGVDPARVGLLGHSMGAGAVLAGAALDQGVAATVAISGGSGSDDGGPRVRNLLVLAGDLEFAGIRAAGPRLVRALHPGAEPDRTYGDPGAGTARRYAEIPGVEHVGVLFSAATHRAALDWFDAALDPRRAAAPVVVPLDRAGTALLLHLAAVLGFGALTTLVLLRRAPPVAAGGAAAPDPGAAAGGRSAVRPVLAPVAAAVGATLVMRVVPAGWLPVRVADYAVGWLAVFGLVLLGLGRRRPTPARPGPAPARAAFATVVLTASTVVGFAVPAQLGWAWSTPAGTRLWLLLPAFAAGALLVAGLEAVAGRRPVLGHAWAALVVVLGLTGAVLVGGAPSFVLFVAPLFAALLVWQARTAAVLRGAAMPVWSIAVVGGALLAWPLALTFPITA
ncbi:alpha/beta hydrolase family protein [Pseudonocardia humida]|uniref:Alpha/beta fold hydrolase n=1 Tax=Pseudonocardia humida TaxID=2800819 RepID=A0ABT0ZY78_9PSEU|nr:alpha/beta fold hydrolase [Pseudonocardia humida]MCO1655671.1 alpha/beta fold hydrolase [Pseudonocardia humida]